MEDVRKHQFEFLNMFYDGMEREGLNSRQYRRNIDDSFVDELNKKEGLRLSLSECRKLADICLANEWIDHTVLGAGEYIELRLTTQGVGVVKSKRRQNETLAKRSLLKKASDYINDHSGILSLISAIVSISSLIIAIIALAKSQT